MAASLPTGIYNLNVGQAGFNIAVFPKNDKHKCKPDQANRFVIFDCGLQREKYTGTARENADDFFVNTLHWAVNPSVEADAPVVDWLILSHPDEDHYNYVPWLVAKYHPRFVKIMTSAQNSNFNVRSTWVPSGSPQAVKELARKSLNLLLFVRDFFRDFLQWTQIEATARYATSTYSKKDGGKLIPFAKFGNWSLYSVNPVSWGKTKFASASSTSAGFWRNSEFRNSASIVLVISDRDPTARPRIVMTADSNHYNEPEMAGPTGDVRCRRLIEDCDVCKVAHHGSAGSSWIVGPGRTNFPEVAKPKVGAIVSAGAFAKTDLLPRMDAMMRWEKVVPNSASGPLHYVYFFAPDPGSDNQQRHDQWEKAKTFFDTVDDNSTNQADVTKAIVSNWNNHETNKALYAMFESWKTTRPVSKKGWTTQTQNNYVTKKGWRIALQNGHAAEIHPM